MRRWCSTGAVARGLREADAADVVQDVFQAVATHLGAFRKRGEADTFRGWLRTIAENKIRDHFRQAGREADAVGGTEAQHRLAQVPAPAAAGDASRDDDWDGPFFRRVLDAGPRRVRGTDLAGLLAHGRRGAGPRRRREPSWP